MCERVNVYSGAHGANLATINAPATAMSYVNRRAATMVPAGAVLGSQPIGRVARSVDPATLTGMRPLVGGPNRSCQPRRRPV